MLNCILADWEYKSAQKIFESFYKIESQSFKFWKIPKSKSSC